MMDPIWGSGPIWVTIVAVRYAHPDNTFCLTKLLDKTNHGVQSFVQQSPKPFGDYGYLRDYIQP